MPFSTTEIRWFLPGPLPVAMHDWFASRSAIVEEDPERTDRYLRPTSDATNVKLRQDGVEVKRRHAADDAPTRLHPDVAGCAEWWDKWRFELAEGAEPPDGDAETWIDVSKSRMRLTYAFDGDHFVAVPKLLATPLRCEVELCTVSAEGDTWWSMCFEASGPADRRREALLAAARHVLAAPPPVALPPEASMSYVRWIWERVRETS